MPSGGQAATVREVPKEVGRQIIDLVISGRRMAATALLARHSGLDLSQAAQCLDDTLGQRVIGYSRQAPMTMVGLLRSGLLFVGIPIAMAVAGFFLVALGNGWAWVLVGLGTLVAILGIVSLIPHLGASLVARFGAPGRGRILRYALLRPNFRPGAGVILVEYEVIPQDGSAAFRTEEVLLVTDASLAKFAPGNVLRVRYSKARDRVFPTFPVEVVGG